MKTIGRRKMKRPIVALVLMLLLPSPVLAVAYEPATFSDDGVVVTVNIEAGTPWSAPFTESVNISIGVAPTIAGLQQVNITSLYLIVNLEDADGSDYRIIAAEQVTNSPLATGTSFANYSAELLLSGTTNGLNCYFAIEVSGNYRNATFEDFYQALSPENFVGPFVISASIESPIVWVGLIVLGISTVVCIGGVFGVKKSRKRSRRRSLSD